MAQPKSFRVGKVQGYRRGTVWYLCYHEAGRRRRPRVGPDRDAAKQLAAQIHAQLETGAPSALSFEPIPIAQLRAKWLDHHEHVLRSSVQSIARYRTATDHLLRFLDGRPVKHAGVFSNAHAEAFVRHLRTTEVSPNGHANTAKRRLLDKGVCYVLETCRSLFNFAAKRRHLPPYAANPFAALEIDRIPIETARPITLMTAGQEADFVAACDGWQFSLFITLMLTGLRPGEVCHLLLPDDLDLAAGILRVRNKPRLGWQVKTRNERDIPLSPDLVGVLRGLLAGRATGPVFLSRSTRGVLPPLAAGTPAVLERELARRVAEAEAGAGGPLTRMAKARLAKAVWRELGTVQEDRVRLEFIRVVKRLGWAGMTAPKVLRHQFATTLQEARVDPLVRNLLMGHSAAGGRSAGHGLGMTAVYTHTRPETVREQLLAALAPRPVLQAVRSWLLSNTGDAQPQAGDPPADGAADGALNSEENRGIIICGKV